MYCIIFYCHHQYLQRVFVCSLGTSRAQFCMTSVARRITLLGEDAQGRTSNGKDRHTRRVCCLPSRPWTTMRARGSDTLTRTPLTLFHACKVIKFYSLLGVKNKFCLVPPLIFFFSITHHFVAARARYLTSLLRQRSCARPLAHSHETLSSAVLF